MNAKEHLRRLDAMNLRTEEVSDEEVAQAIRSVPCHYSMRYADFADTPGPLAAVETFYDAMFRWGAYGQGIIASAIIDGSARDSGNTPTTALRAGLVLGQLASTGNLRDYADANTDGSDVVYGVLMESMRITDFDGNNVPKFWGILVGGPVQAGRLLGLTEQARAQMAGRFIFDDRPYQVMNASTFLATRAKTANYTVVNGTDNGVHFTTSGAAGSVTFTLPATINKGQRWRFTNVVAQTMTITAPANKLVTFNNATATNLAFSTAGSQIGASVEVTVDDAAGKYIAHMFAETANGATIS